MRRSLVLAAVVLSGCAASVSSPSRASSSGRVDVHVSGARKGRALYVQVTGTGRDKRPGTLFEQSTAWDVRATGNGTDLQRLVNGSATVTRSPHGLPRDDRWDVSVRFDTAFELPPAVKSSVVWVQPPGTAPRRFVIADL